MLSIINKVLCCLTLILFSVCGYATVKYDLDSNDTIINVSSPTFNYAIGLSTEMGAPSTPSEGGLIYISSSDSKLYYKNSAGTNYNLTEGGGVTTPGGIDTQIQYNNSSAFGGITGFTYNGTTVTLTIPFELTQINWTDGTVQVSSPAAAGGGVTDHAELTSTGTLTHTTIDSMISALDTSTQTLETSKLAESSATLTYLQQSSATLTYLQISSATASYLTNSSATATYLQNSSATISYIHNGLGTTQGDILYYDSGWKRLGIGAEGKVLEVSAGGIPEWDTDDSGGAGTSSLQVQTAGVEVSSPTASLDFVWGFTGTESPSGEANIVLDTDTLTAGYYASNPATATLNMGNNAIAGATSVTGTSFVIGAYTLEATEFEQIDNANVITSTETDTYAEINALVADVTLTHNGLIDTAAELDAIVADQNVIVSSEIDTYSELNTIVADVTLTHNGLIDTAAELDVIVADYNLLVSTEIDTYSELNTMVADVTLTHNGLIDTAAELDAIVADQNIIVSSEIDTMAELDVIVADENIICETEMDASSELAALIDDETGTGNILFGDQNVASDQDVDFVEVDIASMTTTQNDAIYVGSNTYTVGYSSCAGQVWSNNRKIVDQYDFAVCISTPYALGSVPRLLSPFRSFDITITTISAQIIGGTNVVFMVEQRTSAGVESAGTDIWSADVTAVETNFTGGTASDFTVPADSALVLVITSVSGDVDSLMFKVTYTKD